MSTFDISTIVQQLRQVRDHWREQQNRTDPGHREFPARAAIAQALEGLKGVLYPLRLGPPDLRHASEDFYVGHTLDTARVAIQALIASHPVARDDIELMAEFLAKAERGIVR